MPKKVSISEPALAWLERMAEEIASEFGRGAAVAFRNRIDTAVKNLAIFPQMTGHGDIPNTRIVIVNNRTLLTIVERDGEVVVAAARSHNQEEARAPHEAFDLAQEEDTTDDHDGGSGFSR
jgi:plasmid stabilization system protein ParE